ncbi:MAG: NAD(P)/FAD-dependent oxidoreductase [Helicobacteraceae bacterium]
MVDVIIVGGGVSGLGAALTLGSTKGSKLPELSVMVFDTGKSDLHKAKLYNVSFLPTGTKGSDALEKFKQEALSYSNVSFKEAEVTKVIDNGAVKKVITASGEEFETRFVILACGGHGFGIELQGVSAVAHDLMPKDGFVKIPYSGRQEVKSGIYVAGILAGVTTMFATAYGSGVEAACAIFSAAAGKVTVLHDFEGSR